MVAPTPARRGGPSRLHEVNRSNASYEEPYAAYPLERRYHGLVHIPVGLYSAEKRNSFDLTMLTAAQ